MRLWCLAGRHVPRALDGNSSQSGQEHGFLEEGHWALLVVAQTNMVPDILLASVARGHRTGSSCWLSVPGPALSGDERSHAKE